MKDQLSELEISKVEQFCKDEAMFNAVKKVLVAGIYSHGVVKAGVKHDPLVNGALSLVHLSSSNPMTDEVIGAHLRGVWEGLNALQNAIQNLQLIKSEPKAVETPFNEAI